MTQDYLASQNQVNTQKNREGFASRLLFFLKGFVYSCFSGSFYRQAVRKRLLSAVVFFLVFTFLMTVISTAQLAFNLYQAGDEIRAAYARGEIPVIEIRDGVAYVEGDQPFVWASKRRIVAIDTTGTIRRIDTDAYSEGLLLTRTELHALNKDGYQVIPLRALHESFGNPIILDESHVLQLWQKFLLVVVLVAFIAIGIWNALIRFMYLTLLGLVIWGIVSLKRKIGFAPILITGLYAVVPVIYLRFVLGLIHIDFPGLYTLLLLVAWGLALWAVLRTLPGEAPEPPPEELPSI